MAREIMDVFLLVHSHLRFHGMIRELPGGTDKDVTVLIVAEDDDTARLIGKKGAVANALREAIGIAGKADNSNLRIHLKFESFDEDKKEKDDAE